MTYIYSKVTVNQLVTHPRNVLPWKMAVFGPQLPGKLFGGFTDNLNLPNNPVLKQGVPNEDYLIFALQVLFYLSCFSQSTQGYRLVDRP